MLIFLFFTFVSSNKNYENIEQNDAISSHQNEILTKEKNRPKIQNQNEINQKNHQNNFLNKNNTIPNNLKNTKLLNKTKLMNNFKSNNFTKNLLKINDTNKFNENKLHKQVIKSSKSSALKNNENFLNDFFTQNIKENESNYTENSQEDNKNDKEDDIISEISESKTENSKQQQQKVIILYSPSPKRTPKMTLSRTPEPTPPPQTSIPTQTPSRTPTTSPSITPIKTPFPSQTFNNENEAIFNGRVRNAPIHRDNSISTTKTQTPIPSPTQSPVIEFRDDDDIDDNQDSDISQQTASIFKSYEAKKNARGLARMRPTPSKKPLFTWDDFLSQTSTSIYLGLIGFACGILYAWYAYILTPNPGHNPIPAIFRGNGVDLEEVDHKQEEELNRPMAY